MLPPTLRKPLCFAMLLLTLAVGGAAQPCIFLDFDDDDNPYTIRDWSTNEVEIVRIILEKPENPQYDFFMHIYDGCCNDQYGDAYYGVRSDWDSCVMYEEWVEPYYEANGHVWSDCCPWYIDGRYTSAVDNLPVGERVFIGEFVTCLNCECNPPCELEYDLVVTEFDCGGFSPPITFECIPPTPTHEESWSRIKSLYR